MYKVPEFLSPTAATLWDRNREEFFVKYLCFDRPPRMPQTKAMSVGSSFDAFVKCAISDDLKLDTFVFDEIFEKQVEKHNRSFALQAGRDVYEAYRDSGLYMDLLMVLAKADDVKMEFTEQGNVTEHGQLFGEVTTNDDDAEKSPVVLLGIPDLSYRLGELKVIHDWKVNGYCSKNGMSPTQGYVLIKDGWLTGKSSATNGRTHHTAILDSRDGFQYNLRPNIEQFKPDWGRQLAVYSWLGGAAVGSDIMVSLDQLVCDADRRVRVAQHRCPLTKEFQHQTYDKFQEIWNICQTDHIFRDMSKEESIKKCDLLKDQHAAYQDEEYAKLMGRVPR